MQLRKLALPSLACDVNSRRQRLSRRYLAVSAASVPEQRVAASPPAQRPRRRLRGVDYDKNCENCLDRAEKFNTLQEERYATSPFGGVDLWLILAVTAFVLPFGVLAVGLATGAIHIGL